MKLIILRTNLKEGLGVVERIVQENGTLPILKHVLIKVGDGKIKLAATNLELGAHTFIAGKITEDGTITVPFSTLHSIISNIDEERVSLETKTGTLIVKTDNYEAKIQGVSEEEFPIIPSIASREAKIELKASRLREGLLEVMHAAQFSEIRPEISGILFDFQVSVLKLIATDSFRLAEKTIYGKEFSTTFGSGFKVIVPLKTIQEVTRIFTKDQTLSIYVDEHQILFATAEQELISRLIAGQYPDYEQIIPKGIETELVVSRDKFINAVKLVSNFSGKVNDIKLRVGGDGKALEVFSSSQYLGENNYLVPAKIKGKEFESISFNWRYLIDGVRVIGSEHLSLGVNGDSKPAIVKSPDDASYFYILMPIKAS